MDARRGSLPPPRHRHGPTRRVGRRARPRRKTPLDAETAIRIEFDALLALDRDCIASVQGEDVRRSDEILADGFPCSNPDGPLVDKAGFLARTARTFAIRGFGDLHDGERRGGRHTDLRARRGGRWPGASAHRTR